MNDPIKIFNKAYKKQLEGSSLEAIRIYKSLLKLGPDLSASKTIFYNIGLCNMSLENWNDAISFFNRSNNIKSDPINQWNKSLCYLNLLNWKEGINLYSNRYKSKGLSTGVKFPDFPIPQVESVNGLMDKKVLVMNEQGLGDEILFSSQLNRFSRLVRKSVVKVSHENVELFKYLYSDLKNIKFLSFDTISMEDILEYDCFIAFGDVFSSLYKIGESVSLNLYKRKENNNIGICWKANAKSPNTIKRSVNRKDFDIIGGKNNLISLQYGEDGFLPSNMMETFKRIIDLKSVVTIDTSVAHLSGIMGIPTILVINKHLDWRWRYKKEGTDNSMFYPSIRICKIEEIKKLF